MDECSNALLPNANAHNFERRAIQIGNENVASTACEACALETPTPNNRKLVSS